MKLYYYSNGNSQNGPVDFDELKEKVDIDTLVWHDGLEEWTKATEIEELKYIFSVQPPPISEIKAKSFSPPTVINEPQPKPIFNIDEPPKVQIPKSKGNKLVDLFKANLSLDTTEVLNIIDKICEITEELHKKSGFWGNLTLDDIWYGDDISITNYPIFKEAYANYEDILNFLTVEEKKVVTPEQLNGEIEFRSDIFAIGVIAYQLLTGKDPFTDNLMSRNENLLKKPILPIPNQPSELNNIIRKACAKQINNRYENISEFRNAVQNLLKSLQKKNARVEGPKPIIIQPSATLTDSAVKQTVFHENNPQYLFKNITPSEETINTIVKLPQLYSNASIIVASLFWILPGAVLLSRNFKKMGEDAMSWVILIASFLAYSVSFLAYFSKITFFQLIGINFLLGLIFVFINAQFLGKRIKVWHEKGGIYQSGSKVFLLIVSVLIIGFILVLLLGFLIFGVAALEYFRSS